MKNDTLTLRNQTNKLAPTLISSTDQVKGSLFSYAFSGFVDNKKTLLSGAFLMLYANFRGHYPCSSR